MSDLVPQYAWINGSLQPLREAAEIVELRRAVESFACARRAERHPVEVGEDLRELRHLIDVLELDFSRRAAAYAATDQAEREGSATPQDWIRHECRMSGSAADAAICAGEQVRALPQGEQALEAGRIGFGHFTLLARTARALTSSPSAEPFDERPLLAQALAHSVGRFRHDCAHARHAADAQAALAEHVDVVEARYLELRTGEDGAMFLRGFLDSVGGATLRTALEPLARFAGAEDTRSRGRRLADALVELSSHALDSGAVPATRNVRTHLQVTATAETLSGAAGSPAGELEHAGPVPAATVQRLACDAGVTRVLLDARSAPLDVSRERRLPASATRRALLARDRGCVWPGCERPAAWTS
ncbi:MAG: DUF222 domain-containing protein, partial [Candidatus Dormibacteraeota bacterium]|nr:DUF222 domain-containing protein [Candidatus Dormibacteraeota bacterium]